MADVFKGWPSSSNPQRPGARAGGHMPVKPTSYSPPKGPSGMMQQGPGLHGSNYGNGCMPSPKGGEGKTNIPATTKHAGTQR